MRGLLGTKVVGASLLLLVVGLVSAPAMATQTREWSVDTADELLGGQGRGIGVTDDGRLVRVPSWRQLLSLDEPIAIAAATDSSGSLVLGTGHPAHLWRVGADGAEQLAALAEEQVTAVLPMSDGSILVAAVTPGVLYRLDDGSLTEIGRLGRGGIWDLVESDGLVIAAAGPPAALYKVTEQGLERWVELPDAHARCLAAHEGGVVVGTSGKGMLIRVTASGQVVLLADSPFTEISDIVLTPDGSVWAAALVGEPAQGASSGGSQASPGESDADGSSGSGTSTQTASLSLDLPKVNGATAVSEVLRLTPEGALLKVHRFTKQVASSVVWDGEAVLVGTGFEGEVWRFTSEGGARLTSVDAVQVVAAGGDGEFLVTQGPAQVIRRDSSDGERATFRGPAKSFSRPVHLGRYRIDPPHSGARIRFRSGITSKPDTTWMPWTAWLEGGEGEVPVPAVHVVQWELEMPAAHHEAIERVVVAHREVNLAPRVGSVAVAEPGVVFLSSAPPSGPVIDVSHPDVSGIFSVIDPDETSASSSTTGKRYWRVGYRTVSWKAEDPNDDAMRFDLQLESRDGFLLPVREALDATQLALDTTAVPDGLYRFRITVDDRGQNPDGGLSSTALSEWFVVDNTPPEISLERRDEVWIATVSDGGSPLGSVEWSRDGKEWHGLAPEDGVLDGRRERFRFPAQAGRHLLSVRVIDQHHNRATVGGREE